MKNDKVEFIMNKDLIEVLEYERRGTNPVVDEDIQQLLKAPGVAGFLNIPNFEQVVRAQSDFSAKIDRRLAERLKERGFGEIIEIEVEAPKINKNEVSKEANKPKEETINSNDDIGETENISEKQASKKEFAPKDNDENKLSDNKELEEISQKIEELYKKKENVEENSEEEKQIKEQIEEQKKEQSELIGQYYYLTPERMLENLRNMNGGRLWVTLFNTPEKKQAVERAYLTCSDPGLLNNPEYLNNRISEFLPKGEEVAGLRGVHMLILANTYVGYHVEGKEESSIDNSKENAEEKSVDNKTTEYAMLEFPAFVSDMPEELKREAREKLIDLMQKAINNILSSHEPAYKALAMIVDTDTLVDQETDNLELQAGKSYKGNAIKAYVKTLEKDYKQEFLKDKGNTFNEKFDYSITISEQDIGYDHGQGVANVLNDIENDAPQNVAGTILMQDVDMYIIIRDSNDVEKARKIADSFKIVDEAKITINYAIDAEDSFIRQSLENQMKEVDASSSKNIEFVEDVSAENSMAIDNAVGDAVQMAADGLMNMAIYQQFGVLINKSLDNGYVQDLVERVNTKDNNFNFDDAVYFLSMEADIPPAEAGIILEEAGAQVLEEDEFNPMNQFFGNTDE